MSFEEFALYAIVGLSKMQNAHINFAEWIKLKCLPMQRTWTKATNKNLRESFSLISNDQKAVTLQNIPHKTHMYSTKRKKHSSYTAMCWAE